jgi:hypothetical protein
VIELKKGRNSTRWSVKFFGTWAGFASAKLAEQKRSANLGRFSSLGAHARKVAAANVSWVKPA